MKRSEIFFGSSKVPLDYLAAVGGFLLAYLIRSKTDLIPGVYLPLGLLPSFEYFLLYILLGLTTLPLLFALNGLYSIRSSQSFFTEIRHVIITSLSWIMLVITLFFFLREFFFSRLVLIYGWIFATIFVIVLRLAIRMLQSFFFKKGIGVSRVLCIGGNQLTLELVKNLQKDPRYDIVGYCSKEQSLPLHYLGSYEELEHLIKTHAIDEVIQTSTEHGALANKIIESCRILHVRYRFVPDILSLQLFNIDVSDELGIPLIELKPTPLDGWGRIMKRLMDIVGSLLGMVLLSPFIIGTAIAVWVDLGSWKHIIFRQKRVGLQGQLFTCLKFQSMRPGAEKEHMKMLETMSERKGLLKIKHDPRVTKVGRIIRKTSLDELPQLWNVLKGDMSLVGPRPHMPSEVEALYRDYSRVLTVKPGITGLAQVSGRSSLDFEDEIKIELSYIETWSIKQDLLIILKTILLIIKRDNAS